MKFVDRKRVGGGTIPRRAPGRPGSALKVDWPITDGKGPLEGPWGAVLGIAGRTAGCVPSGRACDLVHGVRAVPGGILLRDGGFALHVLADPSPIAGWLVLTSERHARAWYDLAPAELAALGPLAARVMAAQRAALGADHVYAFAIGDVLRHFHLHLVPRHADTPERLRGRRCFEGRPEDALPEPEVARAAQAVAAALKG